jgi:hypothetical protein
MKQLFSKSLRPILIGTTLCATVLFTASWQTKTNSLETVLMNADDGDNPLPGTLNNDFSSFATVDAATEVYIPANKVYNRYDALALRTNLEQLHASDPNNLAINMALVKFHANAPNFSGGFKGSALQYAASIYRQNSYVGCLAYEYIYTKYYEFRNAEKWYKNSLISRLQIGMEWREVKYTARAPFGVGVTGSFTNGRIQPLYENVWGSYTRKIMVPKCTGDCFYTIVPDFLKGSKEVKGELVFVNW